MATTNETSNEALLIPPRLLTLPEAARYLGCTLWSVRELIWKGALPHTRFGKRFQVDVRDLDELVDREKRREGCAGSGRTCARMARKLVLASPSNGGQAIRLHEELDDEASKPKDKKQREKSGV